MTVRVFVEVCLGGLGIDMKQRVHKARMPGGEDPGKKTEIS